MKKSYIEIINTKFNFNDRVYFLVSTYDRPNVFIKCYGIIEGKEVFKNNIRYHIRLIKVLENENVIMQLLQDQRIRTIRAKSKRASLKRVNIISNNYINENSLDNKLYKDFSKNLIVVYNFFCTRSLEELNDLYEVSKKISTETIVELNKQIS